MLQCMRTSRKHEHVLMGGLMSLLEALNGSLLTVDYIYLVSADFNKHGSMQAQFKLESIILNQ